MDEMHAVARLQQNMRFTVDADSGHTVTVDMLDDLAHGIERTGFSPMELLLVALAGCTGISVLSILRKRKQEVTGYELNVHGIRAQQHPKVFTAITVKHVFTGKALEVKWVERAIALSEERYCGAEAMLGKTATITHSYNIIDGSNTINEE
ncbi:MAG: OsmC family protein [Ktedonobacteraceae bacterium]